MEREQEVNHLLVIRGTSQAVYWLSNFFFGSLVCALSLAGTLPVLEIFLAVMINFTEEQGLSVRPCYCSAAASPRPHPRT